MARAPKLITIKEACEVIGVKRTWLYRLMRDGHLPYREVGRFRYFGQADIRACKNYLEAQKLTPRIGVSGKPHWARGYKNGLPPQQPQ